MSDRKAPGRKPERAEKMKPYTIYLWPSLAEWLVERGNGNIGVGTREICEREMRRAGRKRAK